MVLAEKNLNSLILAGKAFWRRQLTRLMIRWEERKYASAASLPIGETKMLRILPLYEALARDGLQQGMGVSYLIQTDKTNILFDLGNNPNAISPSPLEQNMADSGISLDQMDRIFISHHHPDHIGGMKWWEKKTFSLTGMSQPELNNIPVYVSRKITYPNGNLIVKKEPLFLASGVATTGAFTFYEPFHVPWALPKDNEQALAVNVSGQGLVLITGCGHMGLQRLVRRAETLFNLPVIGVFGGLHYGEAGMEILQTDIQFLQERHLRIIALSSHDSGSRAIEAYEQAFPSVYRSIRVGEFASIQE